MGAFDRGYEGGASRGWKSGVGCVGSVACDEFGFSHRKHLEKKNLRVKNLEKENLEKEKLNSRVHGRIDDGRLDWRWRSGVGSDVLRVSPL